MISEQNSKNATEQRRLIARELRTFKNRFTGSVVLGTIVLFATPPIAELLFGKQSWNAYLVTMFALACYSIIFGISLVRLFRKAKVASKLPKARGESDIVELTSAFSYGNRKQRRVVVGALKELLLSEKAPDVSGLTRADLSTLFAMMRSDDETLSLAILQVMGMHGQNRHKVLIGVIASGRLAGKGNPVIQAKARECMEAITLREASLATPQTLLRGAEKPEQAEDLVRVSQSKGGDDEAERLLRSSGDSIK